MKYFLLIAIFIIKIQAGVLDFKSLQSDFTQTITNDENSTITYTGTFYATAANQALWIYKSPIKKSVYFDGNHVAIVEPELEQVIMTTLQRSPNLTQIIADAKKMHHDTYKATYENTDYFINIKNDTIQDIHYKDKLDNHVVIHLKNLQKNIILDATLFQVKIPEGYDVIDQ
ncbi:LolA-like outer membrane lipoprotein chaperone [Sulfurospirillum sp. 1612]|uniref:LolA-like outer membrane lipoprotein chaperone n=1 Tax=Sulfurospirillum sp. 1612 TaxID=3094835 RepID=UPI002F94B85A